MWFLHRLLKRSYLDTLTNHDVLKRTETKISLMKDIRKRQSTFFGHVMRKQAMEHIVTADKVKGKKSRGRQRETLLDNLRRLRIQQ